MQPATLKMLKMSNFVLQFESGNKNTALSKMGIDLEPRRRKVVEEMGGWVDSVTGLLNRYDIDSIVSLKN